MVNLDVNISDKVHHVLSTHFSGAVIHVDKFNGAERVSGYIIWQGFDDVEQIERQRAIYKTLNQELGAEADNVSIILAYSPQEWEAMHEED